MRTVKKVIGLILYNMIGKHLPESYFALRFGQRQFRAFCGKLILQKCGSDVNIEKGADFSSRVELGDRSGIGINASIRGRCIIGDDVMMGPECTIYSRNHRTDDLTTTMRGQGFVEVRPVEIGNDVWIGGRVIILPGVHIGSHSIIGAGAVVTKDVPEWVVVAGNPAVIKKYRNTAVNPGVNV